MNIRELRWPAESIRGRVVTRELLSRTSNHPVYLERNHYNHGISIFCLYHVNPFLFFKKGQLDQHIQFANHRGCAYVSHSSPILFLNVWPWIWRQDTELFRRWHWPCSILWVPFLLIRIKVNIHLVMIVVESDYVRSYEQCWEIVSVLISATDVVMKWQCLIVCYSCGKSFQFDWVIHL